MNWRNLWNGSRARRSGGSDPPLYYADIGKAIVAQVPDPAAVVLDYRCRDAPVAALVATHCAKLYLYEPAQKLRAVLGDRHADDPKIAVLSETQVDALPDASLDMILFRAVFQHLPLSECAAAVDFAAAKLCLGGRLVVTDVLPPHADMLSDSLALMEYAYRGGFLLATLRGAVSHRPPMRRRVVPTTFSIPDMQRLLATHGFETRRAERNIGHSQMYMTFVAKRV